MAGHRARLRVTLGIVPLLAISAAGCGSSPAAPAAPGGPTTPVSVTPAATSTATAPAPTGSITPTAQPSAPPPTAAPTLEPTTGTALTDPLCDPFLTAARVASVSGPVAFIQGSEHQGLENQKATDLLCIYTLSDRTTVRFQVLHELVNGHKADGSEMDPGEIDKIKHAGGTPVAGLGLVAFSVVVNGTADVVWQVSKKGVNTVEDELDGPVVADLLAIAKLVHAPG